MKFTNNFSKSVSVSSWHSSQRCDDIDWYNFVGT